MTVKSASRGRKAAVSYLPFGWPEFEKAIGRSLRVSYLTRLSDALADPARSWGNARSIIVGPHLSEAGMTLWQCVEAMSGDAVTDIDVPSREAIVAGLCFAGGFPVPLPRRVPR